MEVERGQREYRNIPPVRELLEDVKEFFSKKESKTLLKPIKSGICGPSSSSLNMERVLHFRADLSLIKLKFNMMSQIHTGAV